MRSSSVVDWYLVVVLVGVCGALGWVACTQQQAMTVENTVVTVATDLCKEAGNLPAEPGWVKLACTVEGQVAPVIVQIPLTQWTAIKAAAVVSTMGAADAAAPGG